MPTTIDVADPAHVLGYDNLGCYTGLMWPRFECAPHHARLMAELEAIDRGEIDRLIVTFPPRHGKSLIASTHFPAWYLGRHPERYIICTSHGQELADGFGRSVRNQLRDPFYRRVFPDVGLAQDSRAVAKFATTAGGLYIAAGRNGTLTGYGAHVLLMDDMFKGPGEADSRLVRDAVKAIYTDAAYTRLMPSGSIVLIGTRWHDDDLIGWVLREHAHENWRVVNFPALSPEGEALWPSSFPVKALNRIRKTLGERSWNALYMQQPYVEEGAIIKREWWQPWTEKAPEEPSYVVISVDTAFTKSEENDASACTVWYVMDDDDTRQRILLRYAWAKRLEFHALIEEIRATWEHFAVKSVPCRLLVEAKASGLSVVQELRRTVANIPIWAVIPKGDKVSRAYAVQPMLEGGKVYAMATVGHDKPSADDVVLAGSLFQDDPALPTFRPWARSVIDQCVGFPRLGSDDLVDSVTQALRHIRDAGIQLFPADDPPPPRVLGRGLLGKRALYAPIGEVRL